MKPLLLTFTSWHRAGQGMGLKSGVSCRQTDQQGSKSHAEITADASSASDVSRRAADGQTAKPEVVQQQRKLSGSSKNATLQELTKKYQRGVFDPATLGKR